MKKKGERYRLSVRWINTITIFAGPPLASIRMHQQPHHLSRIIVAFIASSNLAVYRKFDHRRPSVDNDTYSPNSSNDAIDCPSASDDVVDITGVSITVSGEYDHVTISSEMSGLTPASHLHTPTPTSLHPPQMQQPQQRQQPHDQTSQHDLVAGISSNIPFTSPHISSHQTENHTSPPHNNSVGNQHRNS
eukprot:11151661-Ditylum_brightwellii.AAC.1